MTEAEIAALGGPGWFAREGFPGAAEAAAAARSRVYVPAGVSASGVRDETVRTDALCWVDAGDPLHAAFEALRLELNEGAWLGLTRFDLQLARYGPGGRYARHRDALARTENGRRVTAIVYLNPGWTPAHGGQLKLYSDPPALVLPTLGRLVIFLSERVEHEVLESHADRYAATAWYYGR